MISAHLTPHVPGAAVSRERLRGASLVVETLGAGEPVLLVHGFPHTRAIWRAVAPRLASEGCLVIAPDLRGLGDSERTAGGYDAVVLADDLEQLLDRLSVESAHVVALDLGVAPAFALAASRPGRVSSLTVMEAIIGDLPGAERFLSAGPPWWFGLHRAAGHLAEDVILGNEDRYVQFFLDGGTQGDFPPDLASVVVDAYRGRESLRAAFEHYRAMPANAAWTGAWARSGRLRMPVTAVGGNTVGGATAAQLAPLTDDLDSRLIPGAGHILPVDEPEQIAALVLATARRAERSGTHRRAG